MQNGSPKDYHDARILTASQPQLHLMLLEGAVRFGKRAQQAWDDATRHAELTHCLTRLVDIAEALVGSVAGSADPVAGRLEEQYAFIFREMSICYLDRDRAKLDTCVRLLEFERETWRLACDKFAAVDTSTVKLARHAMPPLDMADPTTGGGLSLEA